jgi:hypothetical protein
LGEEEPNSFPTANPKEEVSQNRENIHEFNKYDVKSVKIKQAVIKAYKRLKKLA